MRKSEVFRMKKKFIEITLDGVDSYEYPLDWFDKLVDKKEYFQILGIYERDVEENDRYE